MGLEYVWSECKYLCHEPEIRNHTEGKFFG